MDRFREELKAKGTKITSMSMTTPLNSNTRLQDCLHELSFHLSEKLESVIILVQTHSGMKINGKTIGFNGPMDIIDRIKKFRALVSSDTIFKGYADTICDTCNVEGIPTTTARGEPSNMVIFTITIQDKKEKGD